MMKKVSVLIFISALIQLNGCSKYQRWDFSGEIEVSKDSYYASVQPVRIPENEDVQKMINYDNGRLQATGIRFYYKNKVDQQINFNNLKFYYTYRNQPTREMKVIYATDHSFSYDTILAYLIPIEATQEGFQEYKGAGTTKPLKEGPYEIDISFFEDNKKVNLNFDFEYEYRVSYSKADLDPSGKN